MKVVNVKKAGFTIAELLIAIVVIAILASITIVTYNGVTGRAADASMQSDLRSAVIALERDYASSGQFPVDMASANRGEGLVVSEGNTLSYSQKPYGYCVQASSTGSDKTFALRSTGNQISEGVCGAMVSTLAGSGVNGYADGSGTAAQFSGGKMAVDDSGNIYVADTMNHRIRKVTPEGVVTTLAGSGAVGNADGTGAAAQFNQPSGIAISPDGNLYVADRFNHRIRKVTTQGVVTTFAGSTEGHAIYTDGVGTAAQFRLPSGIAIDQMGYMYVPEIDNHRVRKISPSAEVTTFISGRGFADGPSSVARLHFPAGIDIDKNGNLYLAENGNNAIRKISPDGYVTTLAGSGSYGYAEGVGSAALFANIGDVAVDSSGTAYVPDRNNHRIRQITKDGQTSTFAGDGHGGYVDGAVETSRFQFPGSITIDKNDNIYISSAGRIRKITF